MNASRDEYSYSDPGPAEQIMHGLCCSDGLAFLSMVSTPAHAQPAPLRSVPAIDSTVARYCAAWGTADRVEREALVEEIWSEDGEYVDPQPVRVAGRAALLAEIARFQRENPGAKFRCSLVQGHHDFVRYTWVMVGADGAAKFQGMDFGELDFAGRLDRVVSFLGSPPTIASQAGRQVPSDPAGWGQDLLSMTGPSPACPGGSLEALREHMTVSGPYLTPEAFQTATHGALPRLDGILSGDAYHSFHFRAELGDGGFWGFDGYLVNRGACIVHAEVTSHDN